MRSRATTTGPAGSEYVQVRFHCPAGDAPEITDRVRMVLVIDTVRTFARDGGVGLYLDGPPLTGDDIAAARPPATVLAGDPGVEPMKLRIVAPTREQVTAVAALLARVLVTTETGSIRRRRSGTAYAAYLHAGLPVLPAQHAGGPR